MIYYVCQVVMDVHDLYWGYTLYLVGNDFLKMGKNSFYPSGDHYAGNCGIDVCDRARSKIIEGADRYD